ncbi:MAG: chromosome segregation protein SMC [Actinobacteria bacterium]|nr:chromosome segregation protein SMC [Actinomycetota bacterium]
MHLKSLTLKGFKSFADKTSLKFEPGVSVVIGPNGSGKSNVTDAVLWVLGEQSAKALRGQAMEDVIFAGSSGRKALGVAEVDLKLDNSCGTLPIEFTEIVITRRMYRSGESEYLINGAPCRLMDIHELLHDTGLGKGAHSIISQGQIDEVLNARPEDRRALIEEAAGVLKHKRRKERAVRKLAGIDGLLQRARDLSSQMQRQLKPLSRQASRAEQHAALAEEVRQLDIALAVDDLRTLQSEWDAVDKQEREADVGIDLLRYRLEEKQRELTKFQLLLEEKGLFVGDLSEQRRRLQSVLERINSGLLLLEEKGKNLIERLSELRAKHHKSQARVTQRSGELEVLREQQRQTDAELKAHYAMLSELRKESEQARKERLAADEDLGRAAAEARRGRKEFDDLRIEISRSEQGMASSNLEKDLIEERRKQIQDDRLSMTATLSARRARLEQTDNLISKLQKERALSDADVDKRVRVLDSRRKDLSALRDGVTGLQAEVKGLEEVEKAFAMSAPAMAWVLSKEREFPGLVGSLVEQIKVAPEYERLVEHVLGSDLFSLLVDDRKTSLAIADGLRGRSEGEVSLIPLDVRSTAEKLDPPAGAVRLIDLIECDAKLRPALEALLGDVIAVEDLSQAFSVANAKHRVVTSSGEIAWPSGKVTAGRMVSDSAGVLERQRRINELKDQMATHQAKMGDAQDALSIAEEALLVAQQDSLELGQRLAAATGEQASIREEVGRLEVTVSAFDNDESRLQERLSAVEDRIKKSTSEAARLASALSTAEKTLTDAEETMARAKDVQEQRLRDESSINERLSACQVDVATVSEREVHLKRQINTIGADLKELEQTIKATIQTEESLELLRERIEPLHNLYAALLDKAEAWAVKLRDRARFEQADSESLRESIHTLQDAVRDAQAQIDDHSAGFSDIRVQKGRIEVQITNAVANIVERLDIPLETALDMPQFSDRAAVEEKVHRLRQKIAGLGPVNAVAVQECEALQDRLDRLTTSIEDIVASRNALSKVISAIDQKIRARFLETFEEVDIHFQDIFAVLFPGGRASLTLTDPDDPAITGIEVSAQPSGKKLTRMSLMSGGEKSLTALALLFALYRTKPCPFYILDEVEAALDDANLRRFIDYISTMRVRTQFIIVTHQRRTMEMADVLYGASMHSDGVTKLLSQKIERQPGLEERSDNALV